MKTRRGELYSPEGGQRPPIQFVFLSQRTLPALFSSKSLHSYSLDISQRI